jgi:hypothetical protein
MFEIQQHDDEVNLIKYEVYCKNPQVVGSVKTIDEAYELLHKQAKETIPMVKDCRQTKEDR